MNCHLIEFFFLNSSKTIKPAIQSDIVAKPLSRSRFGSGNARTKLAQASADATPKSTQLKKTEISEFDGISHANVAKNPDAAADSSNSSVTPSSGGVIVVSTPTKVSGESNASKSTTSIQMATKTDLPGRVSFNKNDNCGIDYSDLENDIDTGRSMDPTENSRKKNVRFEDELFNKLYTSAIDSTTESVANTNSQTELKFDELSKCITKTVTNSNGPPQKYCCSLKCNSLCKTEIISPKTDTVTIDHSERIIEEYKQEIDNINRRHELELKWSGNAMRDTLDSPSEYFSSDKHLADGGVATDLRRNMMNFVEIEKRPRVKPSWNGDNRHTTTTKRTSVTSTKTESDDSATKSSSSTVIDKCAKGTSHRSQSAKVATVMTATTSKSRAAAKKLPATASATGRKLKPNQSAITPSVSNRLLKAKSFNSFPNAESRLSEFQIDKVESWMSTHEDTFSDTDLAQYRKLKLGHSTGNLNYKKAWRETPTSKTDDEGNFSLDDQVDSNSFDESTFCHIGNASKRSETLAVEDSHGMHLKTD